MFLFIFHLPTFCLTLQDGFVQLYNPKFFAPPFPNDDFYLTYSEYIELNVGYYYYGVVRDAFVMPWKQAIFFKGVASSTGSEWTDDLLHGRIDDILETDINPCDVKCL